MRDLSKRDFISGGAAAFAALGAGLRRAFAQPASRPRLHALIVAANSYTGRTGKLEKGGWVYTRIKPLRGCVNDAHAIQRAVKPLASSTRMLVESQLTRAAFLQAWQDMVAQSAARDMLLVTYAGHGSQENGPVAAHAPNGLRSVFVLPSFDVSNPGLSREKILDDEMQALWWSVQGRNTVVFVADACHSGAMTRSVEIRAAEQVTYRYCPPYDVSAEVSQDVAAPKSPAKLEVPHVVFLSAAAQHEVVPEITVEGDSHGALSYSFAKALSGEADDNKDGVITGAELSKYVLRSVRTLSDASQHPEVRWPNADVRFGMRRESPLFYLDARARPVAEAGSSKVRVTVQGLAPDRVTELAARLQQAIIVRPPEAADLIWDVATGDVIDHLGNPITKGIQTTDLQSVVDRMALVAALRKRVANAGLDMRLLLPGDAADAPASPASDRRYIDGEPVTILVRGLKHENLILFNIAGDGTVQLVDHKSGFQDATYRRTSHVQRPFGADFVVVINAARNLKNWTTLLDRIDDQRACRTVSDALDSETAGPDFLLGLQGIFTAPSEKKP